MTYESGLVSVIMGCFNADPDHLREAVESVQMQDYSSVEMVIVDDGSTRTDTRAMLDRFADRVVVLRQDNAGVAAARNLAAATARGEYLQMLDSDDRLGPGLIAEGVATLQAAEVEIAYPSLRFIGSRTGHHHPAPQYRLAGIIDGNHIPIASMVRHNRWDEVGGQSAELRAGFEDYEFWVRVLRDGGVARRSPTAFFDYRVRPGSRSSDADENSMEHTRQFIISQNPDHHHVLLQAAFDRLDEINAGHASTQAALDKWHKLFRPMIRVKARIGKLRRARG